MAERRTPNLNNKKHNDAAQEEEEEEQQPSGSSSDNDSEFDEDMESLRKACMLTGTDLITHPSVTSRILPPDSDSGGSDDDDYELARRVCQRLSVSDAEFEWSRNMDFKPLSVVPPDDSDEDGDDDFATLRAVQNRFSAYDMKAERSGKVDCVQDVEQVRAPSTPLEKENSSNLYVHRTNACKGFPDLEVPYYPAQNVESSSPNMACLDSGFLEGQQTETNVARLLPTKGSGFPRAAQLLLDAIKKNRSCQKLIHNRLVNIEARIEENKKLTDRAKILKEFQMYSKKRVGLVLSQQKDPRTQLISAPKKCDSKTSALKFGPEDNSDVVIYRDVIKKIPLNLQQQRWSSEEIDNLRRGIKQEFQKALLKKSVDLISYSEASFQTSSDVDNVMASIKGLEITPENIRAYLPKVDWDSFASIYNKGRSGAECEARWLNWEDPMKNKTKWTRTEDKELLLTVEEKEMSNWIDIAVSLGTNRTPFQCLARFQRSLNAQMVKREWEEEEDARLCAAVRVFGESNWQMVASVLDKRTGTQCSNRWKKTLNPERLRVGRWKKEEDKRLKVSVKLFGAKCWNKIAQFVPGRTQVQCRERWVNCLDPSLKWDPWTEEEDAKLITAIGEYNYCWTKVAASIPPRTDNQCRRRWMALCPDDVPKLQAVKKIQQVALISNFVDREAERPDLVPEDFMPPLMLCAASEPNCEEPTRKRKRTHREKPSLQLDVAEPNKSIGESRKKRRPRRHVKEVQMDIESTCGIVDVNETTSCFNDGAGTIESSVIEFQESFECNEQGICDSSSCIILAPTSTDIGGNPSSNHNSSKRKKYKPRRKANTANLTAQCKAPLSAPGNVNLPKSNSVCSEIPMVVNAISVKKKKTSTQNNDRKKNSRSTSKRKTVELDAAAAAANVELHCRMPEKSTSGLSEYLQCPERNVDQQEADKGTRENDDTFADQSVALSGDTYLAEFETFLEEANCRVEICDTYSHEQASPSLSEDDNVPLSSIMEKKRSVCDANSGILVEQMTSKLITDDDAPLALFIKRVKVGKKLKQ